MTSKLLGLMEWLPPLCRSDKDKMRRNAPLKKGRRPSPEETARKVSLEVKPELYERTKRGAEVLFRHPSSTKSAINVSLRPLFG
jgi:hypothetical protein